MGKNYMKKEYIPKQYRNERLAPKVRKDETRDELRKLIQLLMKELEPFKIVACLSELSKDNYNKQWEKVINNFPRKILNIENKIENIYKSIDKDCSNTNQKHAIIWIFLNWERYEAVKAVFDFYDKLKK